LPIDPAAKQPAVRHGPARARSSDELREGFFRLFLRSYRIAEPQGGLAVYRSCARHVHALCAERWARETIFPAETALVRRFLRETGLTPGDAAAVEQLNLMANPWAATWTDALQGMERGAFLSLCQVTGEDILRTALAGGRGVVCAHHHTLFAPLFWNWLAHGGIPAGALIREWVKTRPAADAQDLKTRALEGARELKNAVDTLRAGGLLHVMADGYEGSRKTVLEFCGRRRGFETTFIDLSLMTGAPILTVAVRFSGDGGIGIEIGPALRDDPRLARAARTEALLKQYVAHLDRQWLAHPADISWFQMKRHLGLPKL